MSAFPFSGTASDLLKMYGVQPPERQAQTSLDKAQAAKRKMAVCERADCTKTKCSGVKCKTTASKKQPMKKAAKKAR